MLIFERLMLCTVKHFSPSEVSGKLFCCEALGHTDQHQISTSIECDRLFLPTAVEIFTVMVTAHI